jgi:hypothetical protein
MLLSILAFTIMQAAQGAPQRQAPIDVTGYWVSVVTEDWRWRMLTPPKGDYASVPLNMEGRRVADTWTSSSASTDGCKAYGAAALSRMPGRLHITWDNDTTLKIEADAGTQTRLLHFDKSLKPPAERSWQGHSVAEWERAGSLKAVTTNLRAGYLRKNGVPYSEDAVVTEYFDRFAASPSEWLTVITVVEDPKYLTQPFVTSTHFKREADGSQWMPSRCE